MMDYTRCDRQQSTTSTTMPSTDYDDPALDEISSMPPGRDASEEIGLVVEDETSGLIMETSGVDAALEGSSSLQSSRSSSNAGFGVPDEINVNTLHQQQEQPILTTTTDEEDTTKDHHVSPPASPSRQLVHHELPEEHNTSQTLPFRQHTDGIRLWEQQLQQQQQRQQDQARNALAFAFSCGGGSLTSTSSCSSSSTMTSSRSSCSLSSYFSSTACSSGLARGDLSGGGTMIPRSVSSAELTIDIIEHILEMLEENSQDDEQE